MFVSLGAECSTLTSSSVYFVANGLAQVTIDPSSVLFFTHLNLNTTDISSLSTSDHLSFSLEDSLSHEQSRAALLIMLNKLIISASPEVTSSQLYRIIALLNRDVAGAAFHLNAVEFDILNNSAASLLGVFILIDHQAASLSAILDVAAALGCEATKAKVSAAMFDSINLHHDDGFSIEEEVTVARNFKFLLNGSGHTGQTMVKSVAEIPKLQ